MTRADATRMLRVLGELSDMPDRESMAGAVLNAAVAAAGADSALVTAWGGAGSEVWMWPERHLSAAHLATFEDIHRREPWPLAVHTRDGSGDALRLSDVLSGAQFRSTEMYGGLYRELGVRHQVAFSVPTGGAEGLCVALQRQGRDFSTGDRERLSALRRPLAAALGGWAAATPTVGGTLTAREEEVLALAARGLGDRQIAYRLGVRPATVSKHLQHVYQKTGTSNRTHAAAVARPPAGRHETLILV